MTTVRARPLCTALSCVALSFAAASASSAADVEKADPALWSFGDEDTTITLFGTVHVMRPEVDWFHGRVREAFDAADEVVLEVLSPEPDEKQALVMDRAIDPSGRRLRMKLETAERWQYENAMRSVGLPSDALDPFEPWMAALTLAVLPMMQAGYRPELGVDEVLSEAAKEAGKTMTGLETTAQQLDFFDTLDERLQLDMLNATVAEVDAIRFLVREMDALWSAGRVEELGETMRATMSGQADEAIAEILLDRRNRVWADWVVERLKRPGEVFLAVGAGHLAGDGNLRELLEARGYELERVGARTATID